jgi:CheB methylesterase
MPIDHFFRSVAEDQGSTAIGVILSGTGSGGTLGLAAWNRAQAFSTLFSRGHAIGRGGREMRAPILDQPLTTVPRGDVEKVDRYHGDDRPIRTVDIVQSKERIDDREIGFDEADPVVGERRLRVGVDRLCLGTEVLHHRDSPMQKVTHWRYEGSIFGE